jgi:PST family polysaccharide transporter
MTYLTFVLGAMGTDFFPRLTEAMKDKKSVGVIVNQQTEIALLLCGPILVAMLGCAPLVIWILYTSEFEPAIEVLRWQILGDILKVISWPLSFILLASGAGKTFVAAETIGMGIFVVVVALGLPVLGVTATGVGFLAMYAAYLPVVWWLGGRKIGHSWPRAVVWQIVITIAAAGLVFVAGTVSDMAGILSGLALAVIMALWALTRISSVTEASGKLAVLVGLEQKIARWIKQKNR